MNSTSQSQTLVQYTDFEKMLFDTFKVTKKEDLPFQKVEHVFNMFKDSQDFSFNDQDERLSNLLILSACLYSVKKKERICFISPTYYYAQQAAVMRNAYQKNLGASAEDSFPVMVPGLFEYEECVLKSTVIFMHGTDFSSYIPKEWTGRKIIQIFPNVDVPIDPSKPHYY